MLSKLRSFQTGVSLETLAQQGERRDVMMDGGSCFRVECSPTGRHRDGFNVERIELENLKTLSIAAVRVLGTWVQHKQISFKAWGLGSKALRVLGLGFKALRVQDV